MYADRFAQPKGIKPGSLTVAIGVNAALIAALLFASPDVARIIEDPPLVIDTIAIPLPPEPIPPEPRPQPRQSSQPTPERIDTTPAKTSTADDDFVLPPIPPTNPGTLDGSGSGGVDVVIPPVRLPILTDASVDPRYADALQPAYPPGERRAERSGKVTIRVLIGTDGRVKRAERIAADTDAFWRATERQALTRWRFRPATRDSVAVEAWRTMTLRFEMED